MKFDFSDPKVRKNLYDLYEKPTVNKLREVIGKELSDKYIPKNARTIYESEGCYRTVYLVGKYAFKFPRCSFLYKENKVVLLDEHKLDYYLPSNIKEIKRWKTGNNEYLCPIEYYSDDNVLIIMKRAKVLDINFHQNKKNILNKFIEFHDIQDGNYDVDLHEHNLGILNKRW